MEKCLKALKAQLEVFRDEVEKMREKGGFLITLIDVVVERIDKGDFDEPDQKQGKT